MNNNNIVGYDLYVRLYGNHVDSMKEIYFNIRIA